jgi:PAS domain S-box-containing protein
MREGRGLHEGDRGHSMHSDPLEDPCVTPATESTPPTSETRQSSNPVEPDHAELLALLANDVAGTKTFDEALEVLLRSLCEQAEFSVAQAWTRRMRDAMLECAPSWYAVAPGFAQFRAAGLARSFERGGGIPGRVWETGRYVWVEDVRVDPRFRRREEAAAAGLAGGLFVPVVADDEVVAVIELFSTTKRPEDPSVVDLARDVAQRIAPCLRRRRAIEESHLLYTALEQMTEAVVITTAEDDPVVVFVSSAFERITGFSAEEVIGRRFLEVTDPSGDDASLGRLRRALQERHAFFAELRGKRKNGTHYASEWSGSVVTKADGSCQSFIFLHRDMTALDREQQDRARLAESVRKAVTEWQRTFDAIDTPIWILDLKGHVVRLNSHAQNLSGRRYSATIGALIADLGSGEPWSTAAELVTCAARTRTAVAVKVQDEVTRATWDLTATIVDGSRPAGAQAEVPPRVLVVARDITRLVTLQESLRKSETMATMGAIVAGVAHEVRNPLFGISATIDALELRLEESSAYREYTAVLRTEVSRLTTLMSELLEYGRPSRLELQRGSFAAVIEEAVHDCLPLAREAAVTITHRSADDLPSLVMDTARLTQVFRNLIENAIQHSRRGDTVELLARHDPVTATVVCTVRDRGPGIRDEDLAHIFEPFFTRRRGGTGLGLSLVWRFVEEHSGTVVPSHAPGGGALLTVTFPTSPKKEAI